MVKFQRKLSFFKVLEGVKLFARGVKLFPGGGGSNCLFPIETHITRVFPMGGPDSLSLLDLHLLCVALGSQVKSI